MMTRRVVTVLLAMAVLALAPSSALLAHEGHDHKVMGTITMAAADHVMVKDKAGKELTIKVTKDTKIKSKTPIKVEELAAGTRVVVTAAMEKDKSLTAKTIEVGTAAPAGTK